MSSGPGLLRPPYFLRVAGATVMNDANRDRRIDENDNVIVWKSEGGEQYIYLNAVFNTLFNLVLSNMTYAEREQHKVMINSSGYDRMKLFATKYNRKETILKSVRTPIFSQRIQDTITRAIKLMFAAKQQTFRPRSAFFGGKPKKNITSK